MLQTLKHIRDFMDEEALKWLPGSLLTGQFILLKRSTTKDGVHHQVIELFDQSGVWIGTVENPDFIPSNK